MKTFLLFLTAFFAFPAFADEAPCGYLGGCDFVVVPPPPEEPPVYDGPAIGEKVQEAE